MLTLGTKIGGRYLVKHRLGRGGFGETYLAEDQHLPNQPKCVVKRLMPHVVCSEILRLFEQEANVLHSLGNQHNQIPRLLAHFEENGEYFLIQDFIEGHNLGIELFPGRVWSQAEVIKLLRDIFEILDFVHRQNVIHRDIKPSNIMRRQDGKLVLIDFGAVKQVSLSSINAQGEVSSTIAIGTQGYMPTEQSNGHPKLCSDIYAVGMIGIQALTGVAPWKLPKDSVTLEVIWKNNTQVNDQFADILTMMIRHDYRHRFQSVVDVLQALEDLKPTTFYFWYKRANELKKAERYAEAVDCYDKAIRIRPTYPKVWVNRGIALHLQMLFREAIASYSEALELQPDYQSAHRYIELASAEKSPPWDRTWLLREIKDTPSNPETSSFIPKKQGWFSWLKG